MDQSSRRIFLATCLGAIAAAGGGATLYPVFRYLAPRKGDKDLARVSFPEAEVPPGGAKFFSFRGETGVVVRKKNGELAAFSAVCTHLGCVVQWENEKQDFLCPCHAGRYTADGDVLSGPPPRPLARLALTVANGAVTIG
jgi:cytochrome b6-f complex iron-sulfur subunit